MSHVTSRVRAWNAENAASLLNEAVQVLSQTGLVAFPTETVYGVGADATSPKAVAGIYAAKGRPAFNPLIAHVGSLSGAKVQGIFSRQAERLAQAFWPGPLTLVLPVASTTTVCSLARAGLGSVALRVPNHPLALALLDAAGFPIAAPSANRSGRISPVTARHVLEDLGTAIDLILDGGATAVGVESTIISCLEAEPRLLRPGGIARAEIQRVLGVSLAISSKPEPLVAPGMMQSHYAPNAQLRLNAARRDSHESGLDFGATFAPAGDVLDLSPKGDLREAAANLFDYLHRLDRLEPRIIAVAPIPDTGLGEAINDRLQRAAAPR